MNTELDGLEAEYPGWDFGAQWTARASGPDMRLLFAEREGIKLLAEDAAGLLRLLREKSGKSQGEVVHRRRDLGKRVHSSPNAGRLESAT